MMSFTIMTNMESLIFTFFPPKCLTSNFLELPFSSFTLMWETLNMWPLQITFNLNPNFKLNLFLFKQWFQFCFCYDSYRPSSDWNMHFFFGGSGDEGRTTHFCWMDCVLRSCTRFQQTALSYQRLNGLSILASVLLKLYPQGSCISIPTCFQCMG